MFPILFLFFTYSHHAANIRAHIHTNRQTKKHNSQSLSDKYKINLYKIYKT